MRNTIGVVAVLLALSSTAEGEGAFVTTTRDLCEEFESSYSAWKQHCENVQDSSSVSARLQSADFQRIMQMGPSVLPLVAEKCIQDTNFVWATWAWTRLTKIHNDPAVNPWAKDSVKVWWEGGRELARERFLSQYRELKLAMDRGRVQEAEKYRKAIRSMGILALGPMMEQLDLDDEVLPLITEVIGDEIGGTNRDKQTIRSWWTANKEKYELPRQSSAARGTDRK